METMTYRFKKGDIVKNVHKTKNANNFCGVEGVVRGTYPYGDNPSYWVMRFDDGRMTLWADKHMEAVHDHRTHAR